MIVAFTIPHPFVFFFPFQESIDTSELGSGYQPRAFNPGNGHAGPFSGFFLVPFIGQSLFSPKETTYY